MNRKYVVRFLADYLDGYYFSKDHPYQPVSKFSATVFDSLVQARETTDQLNRPGLRIPATVELLCSDPKGQ